MNLIRVRPHCAEHVNLLYDLLAERGPGESISHKTMPSRAEHCLFVRSSPYAHWYIATVDRVRVGAVYLTKQREVGVAILKAHQRFGYARAAVTGLRQRHPGRFVWNVNPSNIASIALARQLGFGPAPIQYTYAMEAK